MLETHNSVERLIKSKQKAISSEQNIRRDLKDGVKQIKNTFVLCSQLSPQIVSKLTFCTDEPYNL